jgi:hypothetical protein
VGLEALCEAKTRSVNLLGAVVLDVDPPPQETRPKSTDKDAACSRADFFKLQAPNHRKTRDLSAKYRIIAEPAKKPGYSAVKTSYWCSVLDANN